MNRSVCGRVICLRMIMQVQDIWKERLPDRGWGVRLRPRSRSMRDFLGEGLRARDLLRGAFEDSRQSLFPRRSPAKESNKSHEHKHKWNTYIKLSMGSRNRQNVTPYEQIQFFRIIVIIKQIDYTGWHFLKEKWRMEQEKLYRKKNVTNQNTNGMFRTETFGQKSF